MNIHQGMFLLQRGGKRLIHVVIHVFLWETKKREITIFSVESNLMSSPSPDTIGLSGS